MTDIKPDGQHDAHVQVLTAEVATRTSDLVPRDIRILRLLGPTGWVVVRQLRSPADAIEETSQP